MPKTIKPAAPKKEAAKAAKPKVQPAAKAKPPAKPAVKTPLSDKRKAAAKIPGAKPARGSDKK